MDLVLLQGIVAIRPLLSHVNQICLITAPSRDWKTASRKLKHRHGVQCTNVFTYLFTNDPFTLRVNICMFCFDPRL